MPTTAAAFGDATLGACPANRSEPQLDLMALSGGDRATMKLLRYSGVVPIRYEVKDCAANMVLLPNCIGEGAYFYTPHSIVDRKVMRDSAELHALLPLGAASLESSVTGDRALRTDFEVVGIASLPPGTIYGAHNLRGTDCERATHIIHRLYVGGFSMAGAKKTDIDAGASWFGIGASGQTTSVREGLLTEGNPVQCKKAIENGLPTHMCDVPVRVDLLKIAQTTRAGDTGEIWQSEPGCELVIASGASERTEIVAGRGGYFYNFVDKLGSTMNPPAGAYAPTGGVARVAGRLAAAELAFSGIGFNFTDPLSFYDASGYAGIAFEAKGGGSARVVRMGVPDFSTSPDGNVCSECFNDFGASIELDTTWKEYRIPFAAMTQSPGWGQPRPNAIDPRAVAGMSFKIAGPGQDYDVSLRNVRFLGCIRR